MTKDEIQKKFPKYTIYYEPNPNCKWCNGEGVVKTGGTIVAERPCVCVCIDPIVADSVQEAFNNSAREFQRELEEEHKARISRLN
jgi:hypothetical protein